MNTWSAVTQKRVSEDQVRCYANEHGWTKLEAELRYWLSKSKAPKPEAVIAWPNTKRSDPPRVR